MAKKHERLTKRGDKYYLRIKVPEALRAAGLIKFREYKRSLGTSDFAEAHRLLKIEQVAIDAEIAAARRKLEGRVVKTLSRSEMEHLAVQLFHSREAKRLAAAGGGPDGLSPDEAKAEAADWLDQLQAPDDDEARNIVNNAAKRLLSDNGVDLDTASPEWRDFLLLVRRVYLEEADRTLRELRSDYSATPGDQLFAGIEGRKTLPDEHNPARAGTWTLTTLIESFRKEPDQLALAPKSKVSHDARDRIYKEVLGADTYITDIKRSDIAKVRDLLIRLPANATKRFPGLTATQVAAKADAEGHAPMTRKNAAQYLSNLHTIFKFAVTSGLLENNVVSGISVGTDGVPDDEQRNPFSPEQLQKMFHAPLFTGCVDDERGFNRIGPNHPRRGRFWLPLIALHSGLRMNEIAQLYCEDIEEMDGHHVIVVRKTNAKGGKTEKTLKTKNARRYVPVHPELVKMGFLAFVAKQRRANNVRLFPEIKAHSTTGMYSGTFTKSFAYFLKATGVKEELTVFHSFRHNFTDALRAAYVGRDHLRLLGGWSDGTSTEDRYGSGLPVELLADAINRTSFKVDLSHLYQHAPAADE